MVAQIGSQTRRPLGYEPSEISLLYRAYNPVSRVCMSLSCKGKNM